MRSFQVFVDGEQLGTIREGEERRIPLLSGVHRLRLKVDWCNSPEVTFTAGPDNNPEYVCRASNVSPLDPIIRPRHYIEVAPADGFLVPQRPWTEDLGLRLAWGIPPIILLAVLAVALGVSALVYVLVGVGWMILVLATPMPRRKPKGAEYPPGL